MPLQSASSPAILRVSAHRKGIARLRKRLSKTSCATKGEAGLSAKVRQLGITPGTSIDLSRFVTTWDDNEKSHGPSLIFWRLL
jgi:hypothetical protein